MSDLAGIMTEQLDVDVALVSLAGEVVYANPCAAANWSIGSQGRQTYPAFADLWTQRRDTLAALCRSVASSTGWRPFTLCRRHDGRRMPLKGRLVRPQAHCAPALILICSDPARCGAFTAHAEHLRLSELEQRARAGVVARHALDCAEEARVEIVHRTRNHFALLLSMCRFARRSPDVPAQDLMAQLERRVAAVAALHDVLNRSPDSHHVRMDELLASICAGLQQSTDGAAVSVVAVCGPITLDAGDATPLSLITNEAITNALQLPLPTRSASEIRVTLEPEDDNRLALTVSDNVSGPHVEPQQCDDPYGSRSRMIAGLAYQLGADVSTSAETEEIGRSLKVVFRPRPVCVSQEPTESPAHHPPSHHA